MAPIAHDLKCVVVTPERALLDARADSIVVPMVDGELGVLPGRAAMVGRLGFGELRIRLGDKIHYLYVDGGFVQVQANVVTVLTARALKAEEISPDAAQEALLRAQSAQKTAVGDEAQETQRVAQQKVREQLRVARHRQTGDSAGTT